MLSAARKTVVQSVASSPPPGKSQAAGPAIPATAQLRHSVETSPLVTAQRKKKEELHGGAMQKKKKEELPGKH